MKVYAEDPPVGQLVMAYLANDVSVLARWDGIQWWTENQIPVANEYVINWQAIN
jgi:hypothetical protein